MIRVFIGYDATESAAYHVLAHSIMRRSSMPVSITPVRLSNLEKLYMRERAGNESTEFSMSRFLVPSLADFSGWGIFMDCDMLCQGDIAELWRMRDMRYAVQCVQHDYTPSTDIKMLGARQEAYPKKNWSSLMLMNFAKCRNLSPQYVNDATGAQLHQFQWVDHECEMGELPEEWNWLVGEYPQHEAPKMLHWTLGGPWWHQYRDAPYADLWRNELGNLLNEAGNAEADFETSRLFKAA